MPAPQKPTAFTPGNAPKGDVIMKANEPMSREQVREKASGGRRNTAERARAIEDRLRERRGGGDNRDQDPARPDQPEPRESNKAPQPEPEVREEAPTGEEAEGGPTEVEQESADASGDEEVALRTLDDLAEHLEIDKSVLDGLVVTQKIDGESREVPLKEALENSQFAAANTKKRQELAARERRLEAENNEQVQQYQQVLNEGRQRAQAAAQLLQSELQSPGVQALKEQDPQSYLQWQEMTQQRLAQLDQTYQQLAHAEQQALAQHRQAVRQAGLQRLREAIPDIDSGERRNAIKEVFEEFGSSEQEMASILDDRLIVLAHRYAETKAERDALKAERDENRKRAKQVVEESRSERPRRANRGGNVSKKKIEAAKEKIKGKRGHAARRATQEAFFTMLQERRR